MSNGHLLNQNYFYVFETAFMILKTVELFRPQPAPGVPSLYPHSNITKVRIHILFNLRISYPINHV